MTRQLRPEFLARLQLEAETIETVMLSRIQGRHRDLSNHAANWQPAPMPSDWLGDQPTRREP